MRIRFIPHCAVVVLALACSIVAAACVASPTAPPDAVGTVSFGRQADRAHGSDLIAEAQQPMAWLPRPSYGSGVFPFKVDVEDDGEGEGGGWQKANVVLYFNIFDGIEETYKWNCPLEIGMPLRSKAAGRISASRAALVTAEVATDVVGPLGYSRPTWEGLGALFCQELRDRMNVTFKKKYPGYGAKVKKWQ